MDGKEMVAEVTYKNQASAGGAEVQTERVEAVKWLKRK